MLIRCGIGSEKAGTCIRQLPEIQSWDLIVSSGFAGALDDTASIGSVLIGEEVVAATSSPVEPSALPIPCHPDWVNLALTTPWNGSGVLRSGKFACVDHVLTRAEEKHAVQACTKATAVDMESATIGKMAQGQSRPFLIIRAISDGVNDDLPVDFNLFLAPSGWAVGVRRLLSTPKSWKGLWNLYRHSKKASRQLTIFFEAFFSRVLTLPESSAPGSINHRL